MRKKVVKLSLLLIAALLFLSCRSETANNPPSASQEVKGQKMELKVTSTAFQEGGMIPQEFTHDGANVSPPLSWESVPEKTKSLALIADDPDAPGKTWVHWVAFNLPPTTKGLPANVPAQEAIPGGGRQGTNDFGKVGCGGPQPPRGVPRYYFKLYALDTELNLDSSATKDQLLKAMDGHVLAEGQLMGKYQSK